jgi:hypothetical protein
MALIPNQYEVASIGVGTAYAAPIPIDATSYKNGIILFVIAVIVV